MQYRRIAVMVGLLLVCGCDKPTRTPAKSPRIVTFAPHITDIAFDMGLGEHVVGVSSRCILPPGESRTVMGDAFKINSEAILSEDPDIVLYNTKDSDYDTLRRLRPSLKLVRMRNGTLAELKEGIAAMGVAVGREDLSAAMLKRIDADLEAVRRRVSGRPTPRVLFVLGTEHPSTIGSGWVTDELLRAAGGANAAAELKNLTDWSNINMETVLTLQPDILICQCGPGEQNIRKAKAYWNRLDNLAAVQNGRVYVTDDPRLTIPGSRVAQTAEKLARMIHPDAFAEAGGEGSDD